MSWIDFLALVFVVPCVLHGAGGGLTWAVLESLVILGAALAARAAGPHADPYVDKIAHLEPAERQWVAYLAVFLLSICMMFGVALLLKPQAEKARFRRDGWFGGVWGFVNGLTLSAVAAAVAMTSTARSYDETLSESLFVRLAAWAADSGLGSILPEHVAPRAAALLGG